jgi:type I restriction-modification system DNA methylase subunit
MSELIGVFKSCLSALAGGEGLTGDKALRNFSYLLTLKLIEPNNEINFYDYDYDLDEKHKNKMLRLVRFSNLANENEEDLPDLMRCLWDDVLSVHPTTKKIFLKGKGFDIQHIATYKKIIDKLNTLDLSQTEYDVLGNAYEAVIQCGMTGKLLGQYFTQPLVKKMMVELIDPQIHPDGTIDTCGDPAMGSGGFLITYLHYILKQAKAKNIKPDWNYIKTVGLYGKEVEADTYQLAVSNMLISSGHVFNLDHGDSIREPITKKFDNVLANPPFGIKGLKYDHFKKEYFPIKTNNAVSLFIQLIIYMLKIGGKCAVVLPYGADIFSQTNDTLIAVRKYLLKTCDLKEIIHLPNGSFTYTVAKTCVFYFVKRSEGTDVLCNEMKERGTTYQTTEVKFYDYSADGVKTLLVCVPIEKIVGNCCSLDYVEYIEEKSEQYEEGVVVRRLGDIGEFLPKSKKYAKCGKEIGAYPFYTSSPKLVKYCDAYDYEDECLIIGTGGKPNIKYASRFSCSTANFVIKISGHVVKYVYYYLVNNLDILRRGFLGVGLQHLPRRYVENIKIPLPSLERQREIVQSFEDTAAHLERLEEEYENSKKRARESLASVVKARPL